MSWSSLLGRGAMSVMTLMFSGECTSAVQNVWSVSGDHRAESARAQRVFDFIQTPFTFFWIGSRVLAGPCFLFYHVTARARKPTRCACTHAPPAPTAPLVPLLCPGVRFRSGACSSAHIDSFCRGFRRRPI